MKEKIGDRRVTLLNRQATIKNLPKTSIPLPTELLCLPPNQNLQKKTSSLKVYASKKLLQLFNQSLYLKVVSYINPNFSNIPTVVQNF